MSGFAEMDVDTIWHDGEYVDWEDATTHVLTHALHYGTGVFEGVRAYDTGDGTAVFRWEEHLDRFYESTKPYDMEIPFSREELTEATMEVIRRNDLDSAYVRPIAYYGYHSLGVSPGDCPTEVAIAAWPWGTYLGDDALERRVEPSLVGARPVVTLLVLGERRLGGQSAEQLAEFVGFGGHSSVDSRRR